MWTWTPDNGPRFNSLLCSPSCDKSNLTEAANCVLDLLLEWRNKLMLSERKFKNNSARFDKLENSTPEPEL